MDCPLSVVDEEELSSGKLEEELGEMLTPQLARRNDTRINVTDLILFMEAILPLIFEFLQTHQRQKEKISDPCIHIPIRQKGVNRVN